MHVRVSQNMKLYSHMHAEGMWDGADAVRFQLSIELTGDDIIAQPPS